MMNLEQRLLKANLEVLEVRQQFKRVSYAAFPTCPDGYKATGHIFWDMCEPKSPSELTPHDCKTFPNGDKVCKV